MNAQWRRLWLSWSWCWGGKHDFWISTEPRVAGQDKCERREGQNKRAHCTFTSDHTEGKDGDSIDSHSMFHWQSFSWKGNWAPFQLTNNYWKSWRPNWTCSKINQYSFQCFLFLEKSERKIVSCNVQERLWEKCPEKLSKTSRSNCLFEQWLALLLSCVVKQIIYAGPAG